MARRRVPLPAESRRLRAPRSLEDARSRARRPPFRARRDGSASRPRAPISRQAPLIQGTPPARRPRRDFRRRDLLRSLGSAPRLEARSDSRSLEDASCGARGRLRAVAKPRGGSERGISARNGRRKGRLLPRDELRRGVGSSDDADARVRGFSRRGIGGRVDSWRGERRASDKDRGDSCAGSALVRVSRGAPREGEKEGNRGRFFVRSRGEFGGALGPNRG